MVDRVGLKKCVRKLGLTAERVTEMLLYKLQFLEKYPKYALLMNREINREDAKADPELMDQKIIKDTLADIFAAASTLTMITESDQFEFKGFVDDGWRHTEEDIYPTITWLISDAVDYDTAVEMVEQARSNVEKVLGEKS